MRLRHVRVHLTSYLALLLIWPIGAAPPTPTQPRPTAVADPGENGVVKAMGFFARLSDAWAALIDPLARRQAARRLRILLNELDSVAVRKQNFIESLELAQAPRDLGALDDERDALEYQVLHMRNALHQSFLLLPSRFVLEGQAVETDLFNSLSVKRMHLHDLEAIVKSPSADKAVYIQRARADVERVNKLKSEVAKVIVALGGDGLPINAREGPSNNRLHLTRFARR